jgi:VWFA-related protein
MTYSESNHKHSILLRGLAVLFLMLVPAVIAQQAPASSADMNLVNVFATVRDKQGKIINNLSQKDFVLEEDGRPQAIRFAGLEGDLPLTLGLLVETGMSQRRALEQERSSTGHFIGQLLREDKDKAFLIHFDREVELLQDLTPSKQKLNAALDSLQQPRLKHNDDDSSGGGGYPRGGRGSGHGQMGATLYDSVYLAANELMLKQQGRKAVIVLSSGVDQASKVTLDRAIESAQRANVVVYSIYLAGKQSSDSGGWERSGGGMGGGPWGGMGRHGGGYPGSRSQRERPDGKPILERISRETGGRMFEISKKQTVDQAYQAIQEELRNQYALGYVSDRPGDASEYHRIHLTTTQKDLTVQAREGFYPAKQLDAKAEKQQN